MIFPSVGGYLKNVISKRRKLYAIKKCYFQALEVILKMLFPSLGGYMFKDTKDIIFLNLFFYFQA